MVHQCCAGLEETSDGLGRIHDGATADAQDDIDLGIAEAIDRVGHVSHARLAADGGRAHQRDARVSQATFELGAPGRLVEGMTSGHQQHPRSMAGDDRRDLCEHAGAEGDARQAADGEGRHGLGHHLVASVAG